MDQAKTILVVDDDSQIQLFCSTVLEASGYKVLTASSGAEGLAVAAAEHPALVILDIIMEEGDTGFQVAEKLRTQQPAVPIIMLSTIADASSQVFDTSTLPVSELINKPIEPALLVKMVKKFLG